MEPATDMSSLSLVEDFNRRFEKTRGFELRDKQKELIEDESSVKWAELVTGYGKTDAGIGSYWCAAKTGRVNRLLYIAPGSSLPGQFEDTVKSYEKTDISIGRAMRVVNGETRSIRESLHNTFQVFTTNIQSVSANPGYYHDLMGKGRWMVILDEFHRYSLNDSAKWGHAVKNLPYEMLVGLSATPNRTDSAQTIFSHIEPSAVADLEKAEREDAIRPLSAKRLHYNVEVLNSANEPITLTTEDLKDPNTLDERLTRDELRFSTKYVSHMLMVALSELQNRRIFYPRYKALIAAASCKHAEFIANLINKLGLDLEADWVGGGPFGRSEYDNVTALRRFSEGDLPVLVQVNKVGEGFDVPECSILVLLRIMQPSVQLTQLVGRVLRRQMKIKDRMDDYGWVFYSADNPAGDHIDAICQSTTPELEAVDPETKDREPRDPSDIIDWDDLPSVFIQSVKYDREDMIRQLGQANFEAAASKVATIVYETSTPIDWPELPSEKKDEITEIMSSAMMGKDSNESTDKFEEDYRKRINSARSKLISTVIYVCTKFSNHSRDMHGDIAKRVNREAKRRFGEISSLTEAETKKQYEWMRDLQTQIRQAGEVPSWLMP